MAICAPARLWWASAATSIGPGIALTREQILSAHNRYSAIGTSGPAGSLELRSPAVGQQPPDDLVRAVGEPKSPGDGPKGAVPPPVGPAPGQMMVIPPLAKVMGEEELGSPLAV